MRIYVAGPYTPNDCSLHEAVRLAAQNVHYAIHIGLMLMEKGHYVFIPHLSHFIHTHVACDRDWPWYKIDMTFLDHWAEALYYIGPSKGADAELARAKELGLTVFRSLREVPEQVRGVSSVEFDAASGNEAQQTQGEHTPP